MVVGFFAAMVLLGKRRRRGGKGGFIQLGEKDGLLGGMGKHD
jgi:protein disulfide-isomerase